eukprot:scaffold2277_cov256-Pinguiococcus_pyrenoidosus.AAC.27
MALIDEWKQEESASVLPSVARIMRVERHLAIACRWISVGSTYRSKHEMRPADLRHNVRPALKPHPLALHP